MQRKKILFYKHNLVVILLAIFISAPLQANNSLTIGFGSCANQYQEQPIWNVISEHKPDLFIMMGDNVYISSASPTAMKNAYKMLSDNPNFSKFRQSTPLLATWDDHDFGTIDSGKDFIAKESTKAELIKFFNYPELNKTADNDTGIFHTRWLKFNKKDIQIIMLDTRWYRDPLVQSYLSLEQRIQLNLGPIQPTLDDSTTMLGQEQWDWLESELQKTADLKILVSSIQVLADFTGWESWANFPHERIRLLDLLHQYGDNNVLILSGDIHKAEISKLMYKETNFVEMTSSGLAVQTYPASNNIHRLGNALEELNYGMLKIIDEDTLEIKASIYDSNGIEKLTVEIKD